LSNATKDSETISDSVIDNMLGQLDKGKAGSQRDLEIVERLTTETKDSRISKRKSVKVKRSGRSFSVRKKVHMKKMKKPKRR
ncbi:MAG: hypothetical protein KGH78_05320, partial [Candidatus Micrarchaeota archaeon]|nr:hypothetical protein [Candidatus Micrarchaeota archaeon]